jgi:hypothetical protein
MSTDIPPTAREDDVATKVQVLASEHWSLLATRSLTYTESLSRVTIFLAIVSGAVVSLALVAQADRFGSTFISIAIPVLFVVLFAGIATVARLMRLNGDDFRWVVGMNRIRHAYVELHPDLEPYFVTGHHDDLPGALLTLGIDSAAAGGGVGSLFHVIQTLPGMLSVVVAAVAGAIGALAALGFGVPPAGMVLVAVAAFVLVMIAIGVWASRSFGRRPPILEPRFPTPSDQLPPRS